MKCRKPLSDSHFHQSFCLVIDRCLSDFKRPTIIVLFVPLRNQYNVHQFPSFWMFQLKTKQWKKYRKHGLGHLFIKTTKDVPHEQNSSFIFLLLLFLTKTLKNNIGYIAITLKKVILRLQQIPASEKALLAFQKFTKTWQSSLLNSYLYICKQNKNWFVQFPLHVKQAAKW